MVIVRDWVDIEDNDDADEFCNDCDDYDNYNDHLFPQLLAPHKKSQLALGLPENFKFHHQL